MVGFRISISSFRNVKTWNFSFLLLLAYILTFHLWMDLGRTAVLISGFVVTLALGIAIIAFRKRCYFVNNFDFLWHSVVLLDILLEAIFIVDHDHYGFYLCALGFATVIGGYRAYCIFRLRRGQVK